MIDVPMPQLGESVAEGTVTKWVVREGDFVEREQVLLGVATDKADTFAVTVTDKYGAATTVPVAVTVSHIGATGWLLSNLA